LNRIRRNRLGTAAFAGSLALAAVLVFAVSAGAHSSPATGTSRGPSSATNPYVLPVADGVHTKALLTVSDAGSASNGYEMVGIPDGLGARRAGGNDFLLHMNHELIATAGAVRAHGQKGAFVSKLEIDRRTFEVEQGSDFVQPGVTYWDYVSQTYGPTPSAGGANPRQPGDVFAAQIAAFARWCSSTLSGEGVFYNNRTRRGYKGQIYFGNEENGNDGRAFGVTEDGHAQQLPRLGQFSWENTVPAANESDTTVVVGQEDAASGQPWIYVGHKQREGNAFDKAGLTNGVDFVLDLKDETVGTDAGFRAKFGKGKAAPFDISEVDWDQSGNRQNAEAAVEGLSLNRVEDGHFDPRNPNDFWFVTTEGGKGADVPTGSFGRDGGGLWKLSFTDIEQPWLGGTLTLMLDGSEAPFLNKPDNITIDTRGNLLIQEDPGGNVHLARIVAYDIDTGDRGVIAQFDPAQFKPVTPGGTDAPFTIDEESSGIIDVKDVLGRGWFLFDAQVHKTNPDTALVEYGQLMAMHVRDFDDVYTISD
jgi:Alkaline phosphatase PhoX